MPDNEKISRDSRNLRCDALVRHQLSHHAMGTIFSIIAYGSRVSFVDEVVIEAFQEIDRLNDTMSHYRQDSELSCINRDAFDRHVVVSGELFELLEHSMRISEETAGAFDITLGALMKAWGFFHGEERVPSQAALLDLLKRTGYSHVELDSANRSIKFHERGVELDLGAIGKGFAVDRVVDILRENGIERALISAGRSSIYALGAPPGEKAWAVSICDPLNRRKQACLLHLRNLSVGISGYQDHSFVLNERIYTHLINPENGEPVDKMLMSVAVTTSATTSDALSTSFFVGGPQLARIYLSCHPGAAAILYVREDTSHSFEEMFLHSRFEPLPLDRYSWTRDTLAVTPDPTSATQKARDHELEEIGGGHSRDVVCVRSELGAVQELRCGGLRCDR